MSNSEVVVTVGQVYETPHSFRYTVAYRDGSSWRLRDATSPNCWLADVEHNIKHAGWKLIGCVLTDGRQMCVGDTWEYDNGVGKPVCHRLADVVAWRDGTVAFYDEHGHSMSQHGLLCLAARWRKVEHETPICSCPDAPCTCCHNNRATCPHVERVSNAPGPTTSTQGTPDGLPIKLDPPDTIRRRTVDAFLADAASRREFIDVILAEDASRYPDYARARKAAVIALHESSDGKPRDVKLADVRAILAACHAFEMARGHLTKPRDDAWGAAERAYVNVMPTETSYYLGALCTYERARLAHRIDRTRKL